MDLIQENQAKLNTLQNQCSEMIAYNEDTLVSVNEALQLCEEIFDSLNNLNLNNSSYKQKAEEAFQIA